jgi:DNA-directed RNA polymerase subunit H (RpoH/RPB5)
MSYDKLETSLSSLFRARHYEHPALTVEPLASWKEMHHVATPEVVALITPTSLKKCEAKRIVETMFTEFRTAAHKIMVAKGGSKQAIDFLREHQIEFITLSLLVFDRSQHSLVPAYRILSPRQRDQLMSRYSTRSSDWPKIFVSDPQAIYMGAAVGDVLHNMSDDIYRTVIA